MDDYAISVSCPNCGHCTNKFLSWLETHDAFTCQCGHDVTFVGHELIKASLSPRERLFWKPGK